MKRYIHKELKRQFENGDINGADSMDELQTIASANGGCIVNGNTDYHCHGSHNLFDSSYYPDVGDIVYLDGIDQLGYMVITDDMLEEESEEESESE